MYKANLSYRIVKKYLDFCIHANLLILKEKDKRHEIYRITEKGETFLEKYNAHKQRKDELKSEVNKELIFLEAMESTLIEMCSPIKKH
jgi:DNA-binding PadR family transcriptional regulator